MQANGSFVHINSYQFNFVSANNCHFQPAIIVTPVGHNVNPILPRRLASDYVPLLYDNVYQNTSSPVDDDSASTCTDDSSTTSQISSISESSVSSSIAGGEDNNLEGFGHVSELRTPLPPNFARYKTELCRQYYELGYCEYNDRCLFAHGKHELNTAVNRHYRYKTKVCTAFHKRGYCPFGTRCAFVHKKRDPMDIINTVVTSLPRIPMPENPYPSRELPRGLGSTSLVRLTDRDMLLEEKLMPSQFIICNYKRLPAFVKLTKNYV